jgi:hypothetical protein
MPRSAAYLLNRQSPRGWFMLKNFEANDLSRVKTTFALSFPSFGVWRLGDFPRVDGIFETSFTKAAETFDASVLSGSPS